MAAPYDYTLYDPTIVSIDLQVTVDNTVGGVGIGTAAQRAGCVGALCTVETAAIRFTEDGVAGDVPTTTFGTLANPGDRFIIWGTANLNNFRAIRTTATSGQLDVQLLRHA